MTKKKKGEKIYPPERRITIAMPFKRLLNIPMISIDAQIRLREIAEKVAGAGYEVFLDTDKTTSNTPVTRKYIVNSFKGDWLLMMDADCFPDMEAATRLLAAAQSDPDNIKKIVAAPAVRVSYPHMSAFGNFNAEGMAVPFIYGKHFTQKDIQTNESKVVEVQWTGFHFVLFHRSVFEEIDYPWFQIGVLDEETGIDYGHDLRFCREACRKGIKVYVEFAARVGHEGIKAFTLSDQMIAYETDILAKDQLIKTNIDVESILDDDGDPINYVIPKSDGSDKTIGTSETLQPDETMIVPKEAIE